MTPFQRELMEGIPYPLPGTREYDTSVSHAPVRKRILDAHEERLALMNALRYFRPEVHGELVEEFRDELHRYGRIYMYRLRPHYEMYARPIDEYPGESVQARAIMHMIQNNLNPAVAQHPHELITYGGNGAVFQNWAQYRLTMQYLAQMTDEQTLVMYSGHPMGLYPSHREAPRVVVTNGMMIPNYSRPDDWERYNALGVTQYGQMTAGSYMYIGPQGIVHGTTITVLNAARRSSRSGGRSGMLYVTSGLGGMSGAQAKAGRIAGVVTVVAEVDPLAVRKRHEQGWVDEVFADLDELLPRVRKAMSAGEAVSLAYEGNVVDLWERLADEGVQVHLGSDQTSLHAPFTGGYYPVGLSMAESRRMIAEDPEGFKAAVHASLRRHVEAINRLTAKGMYFFDYGNAFLLEAGHAGADIFDASKPSGFKYPSYVEDIMGPLFFDYGFGPFRWVCTSGTAEDLRTTDRIATQVLEKLVAEAPEDIRGQLEDNLHWIREAERNRLVVGSQARILYADSQARIEIAERFNAAVRSGELHAPVVLGRDHHDVSGTDSPFRETANIYDGSRFCADMAVQNVIGDSFRGATWVSLHNGGGVGWGEVINGGFGLVLDGSKEADERLSRMLFWDVNNGISRRSWARNQGAMWAIEREMERTPGLRVTVPHLVDPSILGE